jgi:hypothetical protein
MTDIQSLIDTISEKCVYLLGKGQMISSTINIKEYHPENLYKYTETRTSEVLKR